MIKIQRFIVGEIYTNCYLVQDERTGKLLVVDPGAMSLELIDEINARGGELEYILLTHGHFDHITFTAQLKKMFSPKVCASKLEEKFIMDSFKDPSIAHNIKIDPFTVDQWLNDGDTLIFGDSLITFMSTPGHTEGSGMFIIDNTIFSGDTIFYESVGRTDFFNSDHNKMRESIKKIEQIKGDFRILTGHDIATTLNHEKEFNPFFNRR